MNQRTDIVRAGVTAAVTELQPMTRDARQNGLHVLRQDHVPAVDERPGTRCGKQGEGGARAQAMNEARAASCRFDQGLQIIK